MAYAPRGFGRPGMGGGFGMPGMGGMGGGGFGYPGMVGGSGRSSGHEDKYGGGDGSYNPRPGDQKPGIQPGIGGGTGSLYGGPGMGGAGGFGNQGSTGFGGGNREANSLTDGTYSPGQGAGPQPGAPPRSGGANREANSLTSGTYSAGGTPSGFGQGPGVVYPSSERDAARKKSEESNSGGNYLQTFNQGGPSSPVTPNINNPFRPNDNFTGGFGGGGGGGYGGGPSSPVTPNINDQSQPNDNFTGGFGTGGGGGYGTGGGNRTFGTGPITNKNTWNVAGDTSITKGDELAQKMPKKTFKPPKVAMGQKVIGDPRLAMQQLSAMNQTPFMRRS